MYAYVPFGTVKLIVPLAALVRTPPSWIAHAPAYAPASVNDTVYITVEYVTGTFTAAFVTVTDPLAGLADVPAIAPIV
jgi:hypothetical protein